MRLHSRTIGSAMYHQQSDRRALGFVALSVAATTGWVGLYAGLTAKAIGLF